MFSKIFKKSFLFGLLLFVAGIFCFVPTTGKGVFSPVCAEENNSELPVLENDWYLSYDAYSDIGIFGVLNSGDYDLKKAMRSRYEYIDGSAASIAYAWYADVEEIIFTNTAPTDDKPRSNLAESGVALGYFSDEENKVLNVYCENKVKLNNGANYFSGFSSLKNIEFNNLVDTSNMTNAISMFYGCEQLTNINVSTLDFSSCEYVEYMFAECSNLTSITGLGNLNNSYIRGIAHMFRNTKVLATEGNVYSNILATKEEYETDNSVDKIYLGTRQNGYKIIDITEIRINTEKNGSGLYNYFNYYVDLLEFPLEHIKIFQHMYSNTITRVFERPLQNCKKLFDAMPNLVNIDYFFSGSDYYGRTGDISDLSLPSTLESARYMFRNVDFSSTDSSNNFWTYFFDEFDFSACTNLKNIEGFFKGSEITKTEEAIKRLEYIVSISQVTSLESVFEECEQLASLTDVSEEIDLSSISDYKAMFKNSNLSSLEGFDKITFNADADFTEMFYGCPISSDLGLQHIIAGQDIGSGRFKNIIDETYIKELDLSYANFSGNASFSMNGMGGLYYVKLPHAILVNGELGKESITFPHSFCDKNGFEKYDSIKANLLCSTESCDGSCTMLHEIRKSSEISINYDEGQASESNSGISYSKHHWTTNEFDLVLPPTPERDGLLFTGWDIYVNSEKVASKQAATTATQQSIYKINEGSNDTIDSVSYTATWQINSYDVTLDVNGGEDISDNSFTIDYNSVMTLPTPTRTGYSFEGWLDSSCENTYQNGDRFVSDGVYDSNSGTYSETLTAQWQPLEIIFYINANGGIIHATEGDITEDSVNKEYDKPISFPSTTRDHYTLVGWVDGAGDEFISGSSYNGHYQWSDEENCYVAYLTAVWQENENYSISFKISDVLNGERNLSFKIYQDELNREFEIEIPFFTSVFKEVSSSINLKDGKTLSDLILNKSFDLKLNPAKSTLKYVVDGSALAGDCSYEMEIVYSNFTTQFDLGGVEINEQLSSFTKPYDQLVAMELPSVTAKQGGTYTFAGWQVLDRNGNLIDFENYQDYLSMVDQNCWFDNIQEEGEGDVKITTFTKTLYAVWEPVEYRFILQRDGDETGTVEESFDAVYNGTKKFNSPTKKGYDCVGWKDEAGNVYYNDGIEYQLISVGIYDDSIQKYVVKLSPIWEAFDYSIALNTAEDVKLLSGEDDVSGTTIIATIEDILVYNYEIADGYQLVARPSSDFDGVIEIDEDSKTVTISGVTLTDHLTEGSIDFSAEIKQLALEVEVNNISIKYEGAGVTSGTTFDLTVNSEFEFEYTAPAGYEFAWRSADDNFNGLFEVGQGSTNIQGTIKFFNVTENEKIILEAIPRENTINVNVVCNEQSAKDTVEAISVTVDNVALVVSPTNEGVSFPANTGSKVIVKISPAVGYTISKNNIKASVMTQSGDFTVSEDYTTGSKILVVNWKNFTQDATITVETTPVDNSVIISGHTNYFDQLTFNGTDALSVGSFDVPTGTALEIEGVVKYGYENITVSASDATVENIKCLWDEDEKVYSFSAKVTGFVSGFELVFSGTERTYNFKVQLADSLIGGIPENIKSQTLKFGQTLSLDESYTDDLYIFEVWEDKNGNVIATEKETSITLDKNKKDFLESAESGIINIYAVYKLNKIDLQFNVENGSVKVEQTGIATKTVSSDSVRVFLNKQITLTLIPTTGYLIDWDNVIEFFGEGDTEIELTSSQLVQNQNAKKIQFTPNQMMQKVNIDFAARLNDVFVQTTSKVNVREITPSAIGGLMVITDENGNELGDDKYLSVNKFAKGSNYKTTAYTNTNIYFVLQPVAGFEAQLIESQNGEFDFDYQVVDQVKVYRVFNFTGDINLSAVFTAKTKEIQIQFVTITGQENGSVLATVEPNAGMIVASTNDMVVSIQNSSDSVVAYVVEGYDLSFKAYANLGYNLINELGYVDFFVSINGMAQAGQTLGEVEDYLVNGYSDSVTIDVSAIAEDASVFLVVVPKTYNVKFVNKFGENVQELGTTTVIYNQAVDISGVEKEVLIPPAPTDIYEFGGYWTHEYCYGNQYTTKDGLAENAWKETGYVHGANGYVPQHNYDAATNTFTLYAGWDFKKAKIHFNFLPDGIIDNYGSNLRTIILNEDTDDEEIAGIPLVTLWETFDDLWYCEISHGSVLKISPPDIWGYELQYIDVVFNNTTTRTYYPNEEITFDAFPYGDYEINFVHLPKVIIEIENLGTSQKDGGTSWAEQDEKKGTEISYTPDDILTLKAKPNVGYKFLYWKDRNDFAKRFYHTDVNENGEYILTIDKPGEVYYHLIAVFEGEEITVNVENGVLLQYHDIEKIYTNGKAIEDEKATSFKSRIGDKIEILIKKSVGYTFAPKSTEITTELKNDGYHHLTCLLSVENVDFDSKSLTIGFEVGKEQLSVKVRKSLISSDHSDLQDEVARSCEMKVIDISQTYNVNTSIVVPTLFGDKFEVEITPSANYKLTNVLLHSNGQTRDLINRVANGKFVLSVDIMESYFAKEMEIEIVCKRMVWLEDEYRSHSLSGRGTKESPFIISSAQDFALMAYYCNNNIAFGGINYAKAYYKVIKDIDFAGKYWVPIGTEDNPFKAVIDLGSYKFTNITYYQNYDEPKTSYSGLFWIISDYAIITQYQQEWIIMWVIIGATIGTIVICACIFFYARAKKEEKRVLYS